MYVTARVLGGDSAVHPPCHPSHVGDNPSDRHGCRGDDRYTLLTHRATRYPRLIRTTCAVFLLLPVAGPHLPGPPLKYAAEAPRNPGPAAGYWLLSPRDAHVGPRGKITRSRAVHPAVLPPALPKYRRLSPAPGLAGGSEVSRIAGVRAAIAPAATLPPPSTGPPRPAAGRACARSPAWGGRGGPGAAPAPIPPQVSIPAQLIASGPGVRTRSRAAMACESVGWNAGGAEPRGGGPWAPDAGGAAGPDADVAAGPDPTLQQAAGEAAVRAKLNAIQEKNRRSQQRYRERQRVPFPIDGWAGFEPLAPSSMKQPLHICKALPMIGLEVTGINGVATGGTRGISMPREAAHAAARRGPRGQSQLGAACVRAGGPGATECAA